MIRCGFGIEGIGRCGLLVVGLDEVGAPLGLDVEGSTDLQPLERTGLMRLHRLGRGNRSDGRRFRHGWDIPPGVRTLFAAADRSQQQDRR